MGGSGTGPCGSYQPIESRLLGVSGILDIANTKINDIAANYELALDHIPVLGTITPETVELDT